MEYSKNDNSLNTTISYSEQAQDSWTTLKDALEAAFAKLPNSKGGLNHA